ncbi:DDE-domain-containing protein [Phanerochaete sordida]|uniref:DDE-domain-containing protein n=1 Tax=Phanerochaete sordida TaxID=48140 RepID=A0A9P3GSI1_9APHY|nr:DDE-domain-containing protein [Phanerochaete sordida]
MGRRALSKNQIAIKQRRHNEERLKSAVAAYQQDQLKPANIKKRSLRQLAGQFKVNHVTLSRAVKPGNRTIQEFNALKRLLTPVQERVLVDFILESADRAMAVSPDEVRKMVQELVNEKAKEAGEEAEVVGKNWATRFLDEHADELQIHWGKHLESIRAKSLNPEALKYWFNSVVKPYYVDMGIRDEDSYAGDETWGQYGLTIKRQVIGRRGAKIQHVQVDANREGATAWVVVCADGTVLNPLLVFKGQRINADWRENNVANASFTCSAKGYMTSEIMVSWLINDFDKQTKEKAAGRPRALFVDCHSTHYSRELLEAARARNIHILGYPPHCTHVLQGLDVVCFARLKDELARSVKLFEDEHNTGVSKNDFTHVFGRAFLKAFTPETVKMAFEKTGLSPYNPDAISYTQTKPSQATSIRGSFPLPTPASPVQTVLQALEDDPPTAFELDPATYELQQATPSSPISDHPPTPGPSTITLPIDASVSPSASRRLVVSAMASSSAARPLIDDTAITSDFPIPQFTYQPTESISCQSQLSTDSQELPDNIADAQALILQQQAEIQALQAAVLHKDTQIQKQNTELVFQHLYLKKLNRQLRGKEQKKLKKKEDNLLIDPRGGVLTNDAVYLKVVERDERRKEEARKKADRKTVQEQKKAQKEHLASLWADTQAKHQVAVKLWAQQCDRLRDRGVKTKDLPKKPKCPTKKSIQDSLETSDSEQSDSDMDVDSPSSDEGPDIGYSSDEE